MSNDKVRRRALRIAIYINLLGGDPIPFEHGSYWTYEFALMEQFALLGQHAGHKWATEARKKADALIARQGLMPTVLELFGTEQPENRAADTLASTIHPTQHKAGNGEKRIERQRCGRKLRHPNLLSALKHAARLDDAGLDIYECQFCAGLHVGHVTVDQVPSNRRIELRLQEIAHAFKLMDHKRAALLRERQVLLHERKGPPVVANQNPLKQFLERLMSKIYEVSVADPNDLS